VAELIHSERPDLVALVEVGETYWRRLGPLVAPLDYQVFRARGYGADGELGGVTALASPTLGDVSSTVDLSTPFPMVQVEGGELGPLRFVAYHAIAPRRGDVPQWRSDLGKLRAYCDGDAPAIIAGDFNATLDHSPLREVTAGCSDAAVQRGQGLVPTWPTWMPQWFGPQIDHVFVTNPIAAARFEVREITGSDHRAVIVELRLTG
jgi:endonuclease/exonuclease/phosphatase (EEP) superfamily protein YafD